MKVVYSIVPVYNHRFLWKYRTICPCFQTNFIFLELNLTSFWNRNFSVSLFFLFFKIFRIIWCQSGSKVNFVDSFFETEHIFFSKDYCRNSLFQSIFYWKSGFSHLKLKQKIFFLFNENFNFLIFYKNRSFHFLNNWFSLFLSQIT